jgi:hypothetical protein
LNRFVQRATDDLKKLSFLEWFLDQLALELGAPR